MKKLLIVAYTFPPAANVGIYRPVKFAQYLPEFGWEPYVLTVSNGKYTRYDERMMSIVPEGLSVYRAWSFEALNVGEDASGWKRDQKLTIRFKIFARIARMWAYFTIPDNKVWWLPAALSKGIRIIKREKIGHVLVTAKPFSAFLIGVLLKKVCGVHLLVDYRDPWTQNVIYHVRSRFHAWVERRIEQWVIRNSDIVIANTHINEELLVRDFGAGQPRDKFVTIHNGFDGSDFEAVEFEKHERFTITYAGVFYFHAKSSSDKKADTVLKTYSPLFFFEALERLVEKRPHIGRNLRVNFMGFLARGIESIVEEKNLGDIVHRLGYLDYDAHLAELKAAHALLLVLSSGNESRGWVPSKFFSYLGSGNPVLALVPKGEVRDIIDRTQAGLYVDPADIDGTVNAIIHLYDEFYAEHKPFERNELEVKRFERHELTRRLALLLDAIDGAK